MNKNDVIPIIRKSISITEKYINNLIQIRNTESDLFIVGLYLSFIEFLTDLMIVLKNDRHLTISLIARSLFELQVDIIWCCRKKENINNMALQASIDEIKSINASLKREYFTNDQREYLEKRKKQCEETKTDLKNLGAKTFSIKDKCSSIELKNRYEFEYSVLCKDVHNNLESIERRHIRKKMNGYSLIYEGIDWNYSRLIIASIVSSICELIKCIEGEIHSDSSVYGEIEKMAIKIFKKSLK